MTNNNNIIDKRLNKLKKIAVSQWNFLDEYNLFSRVYFCEAFLLSISDHLGLLYAFQASKIPFDSSLPNIQMISRIYAEIINEDMPPKEEMLNEFKHFITFLINYPFTLDKEKEISWYKGFQNVYAPTLIKARLLCKDCGADFTSEDMDPYLATQKENRQLIHTNKDFPGKDVLIKRIDQAISKTHRKKFFRFLCSDYYFKAVNIVKEDYENRFKMLQAAFPKSKFDLFYPNFENLMVEATLLYSPFLKKIYNKDVDFLFRLFSHCNSVNPIHDFLQFHFAYDFFYFELSSNFEIITAGPAMGNYFGLCDIIFYVKIKGSEKYCYIGINVNLGVVPEYKNLINTNFIEIQNLSSTSLKARFKHFFVLTENDEERVVNQLF
jgi:hypothetical protein